jgi:hypothetical protein
MQILWTHPAISVVSSFVACKWDLFTFQADILADTIAAAHFDRHHDSLVFSFATLTCTWSGPD